MQLCRCMRQVAAAALKSLYTELRIRIAYVGHSHPIPARPSAVNANGLLRSRKQWDAYLAT